MKHEKDFTPLNELIVAQIKKLSPKSVQQFVTLKSQWTKIVGTTVAEHAQPLHIKNKTLHVSVDHSAWLSELGFMKQGLLDKINGAVKGTELNEIKFKIRG